MKSNHDLNMAIMKLLDKVEILQEYDLDYLKWKINKNEKEINGLELTSENIDVAFREYKRYLQLKLENPGKPLGPTALMDLVWHYHILDTKRYFAFCENIFGRYLHHTPYFGPHSPHGEQARMNKSRELMIKLYFEKFGHNPVNCNKSIASCDPNDCDCCG